MKDLFLEKKIKTKIKAKTKKEADRGGTVIQGGPPGEYPVKPLTRRDAMEPLRMTSDLIVSDL